MGQAKTLAPLYKSTLSKKWASFENSSMLLKHGTSLRFGG